MSPSIGHRRLAAVATTLTLLVAGCDSASDEPPADEPVEDALPGDDGDAAGGTTMRVYSVSEARAVDQQGSLHITGLLIDDGSGWRLCEEVLESFPPQCGGESLTVDGVDPSEFPLEQEGDVRWQTDATVVGEISGDTLTVTGSAAAS